MCSGGIKFQSRSKMRNAVGPQTVGPPKQTGNYLGTTNDRIISVSDKENPERNLTMETRQTCTSTGGRSKYIMSWPHTENRSFTCCILKSNQKIKSPGATWRKGVAQLAPNGNFPIVYKSTLIWCSTFRCLIKMLQWREATTTTWSPRSWATTRRSPPSPSSRTWPTASTRTSVLISGQQMNIRKASA